MPQTRDVPRQVLPVSTRAATNGDDILTVLSSELDDGAFDGGIGTDTLQLLGGGIFDLRLPAVFTGFEIVLGSDQDDTVVLDQARFAGITIFDGGTDPQTHWDELVLHGDAFNFSTRTLIGIDRLSLQTDNAVLTVTDAATALRAYGVVSQNDTLIASGVTFTAVELRTLHKQGIDTVVDLAGTHTNLAPVTTALHGDRFEAKAGQKVFVDAGSDASITEDDGRLALLSVSAPRGSSAPGRLGLDLTGNVTLLGGYNAGSTVKVGTTEVGLLWDAGDAGLSIVFNANATPSRVQDIIHALTYTMADVVPQASTQQQIVVTLADEGGRRSVSTAMIDQIVETRAEELTLSRDTVSELSSKGRLVGLLTAHLAGAGDSFTYTLVDDAGGRFDIEDNRLVVENSVKLDYEQARSHRVVVRAMGPDNHVIERSFTIGVEDVADEITSGSDGNDILIGGAGRDRSRASTRFAHLNYGISATSARFPHFPDFASPQVPVFWIAKSCSGYSSRFDLLSPLADHLFRFAAFADRVELTTSIDSQTASLKCSTKESGSFALAEARFSAGSASSSKLRNVFTLRRHEPEYFRAQMPSEGARVRKVYGIVCQLIPRPRTEVGPRLSKALLVRPDATLDIQLKHGGDLEGRRFGIGGHGRKVRQQGIFMPLAAVLMRLLCSIGYPEADWQLPAR
ncbi:MAG: hypothetical protein K0S56_871 [Microvirga sp.]|nr:hypothetical protein [Microvirga sp.]